MDEIGITNVQRPGKVVAAKGAIHVATVTSGERGAAVSVVCVTNAAGGRQLDGHQSRSTNVVLRYNTIQPSTNQPPLSN